MLTSGRPSWASGPSPPTISLPPPGTARPPIPNIPNISPGLSSWPTSSMMSPSISSGQMGSIQIPNMKPASIPNMTPQGSVTPTFKPMIPNQRPLRRGSSRAGALSFSYDSSEDKSSFNGWQGRPFSRSPGQPQFPRDPRQTQFPPMRSRGQSAAQNPWMVPQQQQHFSPFPMPMRKNHSAIPNLARSRLPSQPELPLSGGGPCVTPKGLVGKCATEEKCRTAKGTASGSCPQGV